MERSIKKNLHLITIKSSFVPKLVRTVIICSYQHLLSYFNSANKSFYLFNNIYINIFMLFIIISSSLYPYFFEINTITILSITNV